MALTRSTKDLEWAKFRECPSDSGLAVIAVQVCQDPTDAPIRVDPVSGLVTT